MEVKWNKGFSVSFTDDFVFDVVGFFGVKFRRHVSRDEIFSWFSTFDSSFSFQVVSLFSVVSWRHIVSAVYRALRAFRDGNNVCDRVEVESLLYLSGRRQISESIEAVGIGESVDSLILIVFGVGEAAVYDGLMRFLGRFDGVVDMDLLFPRSDLCFEHLRRVFKVSDDEISCLFKRGFDKWRALEFILIERGALVDVLK